MPSQMWTTGREPAWAASIHLTDLVEALPDLGPEHEDDAGNYPASTPEGFTLAPIVARIRESLTVDDDLENVLELMQYADRVYEVNEAWERFYDWCDDRRVWVETLLSG